MGVVAERRVVHGREAVESGVFEFEADGNEALEHAVRRHFAGLPRERCHVKS